MNVTPKIVRLCYQSEEYIKTQEKIYLTIQIFIDITSILCTKERWKEMHGIEFSLSKQIHSEEQLSFTPNFPIDG